MNKRIKRESLLALIAGSVVFFGVCNPYIKTPAAYHNNYQSIQVDNAETSIYIYDEFMDGTCDRAIIIKNGNGGKKEYGMDYFIDESGKKWTSKDGRLGKKLVRNSKLLLKTYFNKQYRKALQDYEVILQRKAVGMIKIK